MRHKSILTASSANLTPLIALLGAVIGALSAYHGLANLQPEQIVSVVTSLLFVSLSLLGFTVTSLSILVAIAGRTMGEKMRETGHFRILVDDAISAVRFLFAALVLGIVTLFAGSLIFYPIIALTGFLSASLVYLAAAGGNFFQVLRHL